MKKKYIMVTFFKAKADFGCYCRKRLIRILGKYLLLYIFQYTNTVIFAYKCIIFDSAIEVI